MLVADDDFAARRAAEDFLRAAGVLVDAVEDGYAAVEKAVAAHAAATDYDLVLLDWKMPGMDGIEVAKALRAQIGAAPPIVMMTSYDLSDRRPEAEQAGVTGFIAKPFFKATLLRCIRQYVLRDAQADDGLHEADLAGRRILLVEDNHLNQLIVEELLSKAGVAVEIAENGQVCVDRFAGAAPGTFDLILMDVHMPVMNGYEATRRIRTMNRPDAGIPILAMTADVFTEDLEMAKKVGMNGHLSKPLDIPRMMREIKRQLRP